MLAIQSRGCGALLCCLVLFFATASAQDSKPSIIPFPSGTTVTINQVETSEFPKVKVYASVSRSGLPLTGLTAKNFRVREDNVEQGPIKVVPQRESISAVVLLDVSGSMKEAIPATKEAAVGFVNSLSKEDKIQITTFHEQIDTIYKLGKDFDAAKASIWKIRHRGDTALYDGVHAAIKSISHVPGRRVVIVLSDGVDDDGYGNQLSKRDLDEPLMLGIVSNIPIYTIGLGTKMDEGVLKTLAGTTGAEYVNAPTKTELENLYERIAQQLSSQYEIVYESTKANSGGLREVKLDYVVPSRKPYAAPEPVISDTGEVTDYKPPKLDDLEVKRLARLAGVEELARENNIQPLAKFIEQKPADWPELIPAYPNASGVKNVDSEDSKTCSFTAPDKPAKVMQVYSDRLIEEDWYIISKTKTEKQTSLKAYKNDLEMTLAVEADKDQSKVNIEYNLPTAQVLLVDRDNANQIIAADGRDVIISANGGIIIVSGGCNKLTISGKENQVQCDSVKAIEVTGNKNVFITGFLGQALITGDENEISWNDGFNNTQPKVETKGRDNKVMLLE